MVKEKGSVQERGHPLLDGFLVFAVRKGKRGHPLEVPKRGQSYNL